MALAPMHWSFCRKAASSHWLATATSHLRRPLVIERQQTRQRPTPLPSRHDLMRRMANSTATATATNKLYYGDNLHVLREHVADESVDLIYLDPPFNSKRDYNLLFKTPKGFDSDA